MIDKKDFYPIGIGTFRINLDAPKETLEGLLYSVDKAQNFMSTALVYDNGTVVGFLKKFFENVDRKKVFLVCNLERYIETKDDVVLV